MESEGIGAFLNPTVLIGLFAGGSIVLLMYILKLMRTENKNTDIQTKHVKEVEQLQTRKDPGQTGKGKKKGAVRVWTNRSEKQVYSHPWLLTSLKGHAGQVLDMDFSSNGKYLASCADEEQDPGGDVATGVTSSSSSDCNKENSRPSSGGSNLQAKPLSRRQRKNRRRDEGSSPENKKKTKPKKSTEVINKKAPPEEPLANYLKMAIPIEDLIRLFYSYLLSPEQILVIGYPVESSLYPGKAVIFKSPIEVPSYSKNNYRHKPEISRTGTNVNAREFIPLIYKPTDNDSGQSSGSSSDCGENAEDSESSDSFEVAASLPKMQPPRIYQQVLMNSAANYKNLRPNFYSFERPLHSYVFRNPVYERTESLILARPHAVDPRRKVCSRCGAFFYISNSRYDTKELCFYHWGRLQKVIGPDEENKSSPYTVRSQYVCCQGKEDSRGCTQGKCHVWNGLMPGLNGHFDSYVKTRPRRSLPPDGNYGVYALDCEMCFTVAGLELVKVTVVGVDGHLVYDAFVRTENEIVDYNSRFSGITSKDLNKKKAVLKSLREVQNDLMGFINADTVLIGHGLENDLRALKIIHAAIIDTAVAFPHYNGLPYRRSLKSLTSCFLKREIQTGSNGHNSYEDARACMDLMLWRIRKDFRSILDHSYKC